MPVSPSPVVDIRNPVVVLAGRLRAAGGIAKPCASSTWGLAALKKRLEGSTR